MDETSLSAYSMRGSTTPLGPRPGYFLRPADAADRNQHVGMKRNTADTARPQIFYGYIVVAAAFAIIAVNAGAVFSFSVFFAPLQDEFGWSRAVTSAAFSLHMITQGVLAIGVGRLNDRFGPRIIVTVCGLLLGVGFALISRVNAVWQLYLLYGLLIGAGVSGGPVPLMSTVARWFRARRGLMTGIVMGGVGVGTMILPPVADWLIRTVSWRSSFLAVGVLLLLVVPLAAQLLRRDPAMMGLQPLGSNDDARQLRTAPPPAGLSFSDALRTRQLWLLIVSFGGFGFAVHSVMVHVVVHATGLGLSPAVAASTMTAIGALSVAGRVGVGSLADRRGSKRLMVLQYGLLALSLFWFAAVKETWAVFAGAICFGFAFGGIVPLNSHIVAELFGLQAHGALLGATGVSIGVGSAVGPIVTGYCYDTLGSYSLPFMICGSLAAAAALLTCLIQPVTTRRP